MNDSFEFIDERQGDRVDKVNLHCPFTGQLIEAKEQKAFEPDFEADFKEWYDGLSDEQHKKIQRGI